MTLVFKYNDHDSFCAQKQLMLRLARGKEIKELGHQSEMISYSVYKEK